MSPGLFLRNLIFTLLVPGVVGVVLPLTIVSASGDVVQAIAWPGIPLIAVGALVYLWSVWQFGHVGRGTPGPWDAPRTFVAVGPYRWVRNPMYIAVLLVVLGEAWLFSSVALVVYAVAVAVIVHTFVIVYEEPTLAERFGDSFARYRSQVPRWLPRPPREG